MADLYHGDCLQVMRDMQSDSIDLTVTSPPYDNLRAYNDYTFDFDGIARELYRVTKPGGVVVWVVGDATINGSETGTSFRQALYFKDACGFNLHDTMIYRKSNPVPAEHNRYQPAFEFMFVLSKGRPKSFNPIMEPCAMFGAKPHASHKQFRYPDGEMKAPNGVKYARPSKFRHNIFTYTVGGRSHGHPAVFPQDLAADHIASWSNPGDVVLDPFMGSGTTGKMAVQMGRQFIGIEISDEYLAIASERIAAAEKVAA